MQSIGVVQTGPNEYNTVFGNRRYAAADYLKFPEIPVRIYKNQDGSPLTEIQRAVLNFDENSCRKNPSILEAGPKVMELTRAGFGINTIVGKLGISSGDVKRIITAYKHIPEVYIGQATAKRNEIGLSTAHIFKIANVFRSSKSARLTKEKLKDAIEFPLNDNRVIPASSFSRALNAFLISDLPFAVVYEKQLQKKPLDHKITLNINRKLWRSNLGEASLRQALDMLVTTVITGSKDQAVTLATKFKKATTL